MPLTLLGDVVRYSRFDKDQEVLLKPIESHHYSVVNRPISIVCLGTYTSKSTLSNADSSEPQLSRLSFSCRLHQRL